VLEGRLKLLHMMQAQVSKRLAITVGTEDQIRDGTTPIVPRYAACRLQRAVRAGAGSRPTTRPGLVRIRAHTTHAWTTCLFLVSYTDLLTPQIRSANGRSGAIRLVSMNAGTPVGGWEPWALTWPSSIKTIASPRRSRRRMSVSAPPPEQDRRGQQLTLVER